MRPHTSGGGISVVDVMQRHGGGKKKQSESLKAAPMGDKKCSRRIERCKTSVVTGDAEKKGEKLDKKNNGNVGLGGGALWRLH